MLVGDCRMNFSCAQGLGPATGMLTLKAAMGWEMEVGVEASKEGTQ